MRAPTASILLAFSLLLLACTAPRPATSTVAHGDFSRALSQQSVDAVIWQHASAEARRMYEQCYELAHVKLDLNLLSLDANDPRQPAVIVDVDETVLDNSQHEAEAIAMGWTYDPARWKGWVKRQDCLALPGSLTFLTYAAERGCAVFYITNRAADEKRGTIENLRRLGFPYTDALHVVTQADSSDKPARRAVVSASYNVLLLVGDQLTDFDQRLADRTTDHGRATVAMMHDTLSRYFVLLPNPMYGVWRDAITGSGNAATDSSKLARVRGFFNEYIER
mgnify:CR=1 FL=1